MTFKGFWMQILAFALFVLTFATIVRAWDRPIIGVGALIVCIAAIGHSLQETEALQRKPPDDGWRPRRGSGRPVDLQRLERTLGWKSYSPADYDHMLRPPLARLLAYRLRARRGIDPALRPDAARALVSEETWELATPDGASEHPIDTAAIERVVAEIEALR